MKDAKRVFVAGFTELPGRGDRCWSSAIDVDQWGARIEVYEMTSAEATELRDEVLSAISQLAAETLRADTAEAELLSQYAKRAEIAEKLAAAEQRVSDLWNLLREGLEEQKNGDDWIDRVVAALNPKPEAGSHE